MQLSTRSTQKFIFVALMYASSSFVAFAQPRPVATGPSALPNPAPGSIGPAIVSGLPPMLEGVVSVEEYKKFTSFQQHLNEDPALKEINAKIATLAKELQQLRMAANATREKLISANPEIKAIQDKIMSGIHIRGGPRPISVPLSSGPAPIPMSGPGPMPSSAKPN